MSIYFIHPGSSTPSRNVANKRVNTRKKKVMRMRYNIRELKILFQFCQMRKTEKSNSSLLLHTFH